MIRFLINLWLTVWLSFLTAAVVQSHLPADFSGVEGLDAVQGKFFPGTPDLRERIEQSVFRRAEPLTISEAQANHYLAGIVTGKQGYLTGWMSSFEHVALQFEPGLCRVWFIWNTDGRRHTASLDITVKRQGQYFVTEVQGGKYGRLPVIRRGILATLVPSCRSLCEALDYDHDEIQNIFQMNQIHFEKGRVVLDPQFQGVK